MNTLKAQIEAYFLTDPAAQQEPYNRDYAMAHFCDANGDLVGVAYWAN